MEAVAAGAPSFVGGLGDRAGLGWGVGGQSSQAARQGERERGGRKRERERMTSVSAQAWAAWGRGTELIEGKERVEAGQFPHHVAFPAWPCLLSFAMGAGYLGRLLE